MKLRLLAATCAALTLASSMAMAQDMTSEKGKVSYYFGYQFGRDLAESGEQVDLAAVYKALQDGYAKKQPAITEEQMRPAVAAMQKRQQAKMDQAKAAYEKAAAENKTKSDQFLAQNGQRASAFASEQNREQLFEQFLKWNQAQEGR